MNAPRGCAAANAAGYETLLTKHDCEMQIERERWFSLPSSSSHLPQGPQRTVEPAPCRESVLIRPMLMDLPPLMRKGWWVPAEWWAALAYDYANPNPYTWLLVRWRGPKHPNHVLRLWRALIAWVER